MASTKQKINPDIQKERDTRTFDLEEMANIVNGGKEVRQTRLKIKQLIATDPDFKGPDPAFLTRMEKYEEGIRRSNLVVTKGNKMTDLLKDPATLSYFNLIATRRRPSVFIDLHRGMFIPTLQSQGTDEQHEKWLYPAIRHEIIGTYAQTEMGHGTFLRGLETTAHYDPSTEEFELNSPTTSSIKWWPGALGKTSTHVVLMAQLYTKGKCYGVHPFMLQIRSLEDHRSMPGITLGDIGPKFGYNENDNGFLRLCKVRIPRGNLLMRYSKVLPDGTYIKPPAKALTYGTMTRVRSYIVWEAMFGLSRACTIAIRYSAVRRQSEMRPGEPEAQVLSYPTQQHKLFPLLATSYAFFFAQEKMIKLFLSISEAIGKGDYTEMQELHSLSSGLKAFTTWEANEGIEICRLSCGGHGYSVASGIPDIYSYFTPACTYEGENTVLMLQTARHLIKCVRQGVTGKGSSAYLSEKPSWKRQNPNLTDFEVICDLYKQRALGLVLFVAGKVEEEVQKGEDLVGALNKVSVHSIRAAKAHSHYYIVKNFIEEVKALEVSRATREVLFDLARFYAIDGISKNSGEFMEEGLLTGRDVKVCHQIIVDMLPKIRPNAVSLVDAFEYTDDFLRSVLGRYDGNVYENLLEWAMKSEMNKSDVIPAYEKHIKPLLKRHSSKL